MELREWRPSVCGRSSKLAESPVFEAAMCRESQLLLYPKLKRRQEGAVKRQLPQEVRLWSEPFPTSSVKNAPPDKSQSSGPGHRKGVAFALGPTVLSNLTNYHYVKRG